MYHPGGVQGHERLGQAVQGVAGQGPVGLHVLFQGGAGDELRGQPRTFCAGAGVEHASKASSSTPLRTEISLLKRRRDSRSTDSAS